MRRLVVIEGRASPAEIEVEGDVLLGRGRESDLRLFDETASRRHARLLYESGRTILEDLDSANGVLLNGERIQGRAALFDRDEILIGGVRIRYRAGDDADRETVAAALDADRVEATMDPDAADPAGEAGGQDAVRRLRLVCDGAAACADAANADELPGILLGLAVEALEPDRATVVLLGVTGKVVVAAAHPAKASAPTSGTLRRRVLESGEAVLIRDARDSEVPRTAKSLIAGRYRSTLAAPLKTAEGVLGFVAVEAEQPGRWGPEDLTALSAGARQAALALRNLRALSSVRAEVDRLSHGGEAPSAALLGESPLLIEVRERIAKVARVDSPVLVTGETGTGKELVARLLHEGADRRRRPFVALNCAAIVEGLLESEFFGHEKGAFTGATRRHDGRIAEAGKGTLFLDEVGDLPLPLQAKLLRVLSEGAFTRVGGRTTLRLECRVVAATNQDLEEMVGAGRFRKDLYYRLAVVEIHLPSLRKRTGDVELLAEAAIERLAGRLRRRTPRLAADARQALRQYPWPGNVRELHNVLERALVLLEGDTVTAADLPSEIREGRSSKRTSGTLPDDVLSLREAEKRTVAAAIGAAGGRKGRTAEILGISWPTLNRKIREYGLEAEVERAREE